MIRITRQKPTPEQAALDALELRAAVADAVLDFPYTTNSHAWKRARDLERRIYSTYPKRTADTIIRTAVDNI